MNIIVVKLSAIGDVIHAMPVSYAIKETYPDAKLTWVVEPPAKPLLEGNPYIDELIVFEKKKFKSLGGFLREYPPMRARLRAGGRIFDYGLDLQGLFKSAAIIFTSGAKKCYGTANMRELSNLVSRPVAGTNKDGHIVERYLDVARAVGCEVREVKFPVPITAADEKKARQLLAAAKIPPGQRYAVLCIGANWPNKRWPTDYFARLSDKLYDRDIVPVFIGGGAIDEAGIAAVNAAADIPPVSLVGKTTLRELAAVVRGAAVVVGGDTGPVHLGAGLNRPTVMIMGPTDANRNGPYRQMENAIEVDRPCKYCWKRACPKGLDCLAAIDVDEVYRRVLAALGEQED